MLPDPGGPRPAAARRTAPAWSIVKAGVTSGTRAGVTSAAGNTSGIGFTFLGTSVTSGPLQRSGFVSLGAEAISGGDQSYLRGSGHLGDRRYLRSRVYLRAPGWSHFSAEFSQACQGRAVQSQGGREPGWESSGEESHNSGAAGRDRTAPPPEQSSWEGRAAGDTPVQTPCARSGAQHITHVLSDAKQRPSLSLYL